MPRAPGCRAEDKPTRRFEGEAQACPLGATRTSRRAPWPARLQPSLTGLGGAATGPGLPLAASAASLPLAVRVARAVTVALAWALITQNLRPMNLPAKGTFKFAIMMSRPLRTTA